MWSLDMVRRACLGACVRACVLVGSICHWLGLEWVLWLSFELVRLRCWSNYINTLHFNAFSDFACFLTNVLATMCVMRSYVCVRVFLTEV